MATLTATIQSKELMRKVSFSAIIPTSTKSLYDPSPVKEESGPLKTLYLLHGWDGNHEDWMQNSRIVKWATEYNIAVIMPSGENSFYVDHPSEDNYGKFIGEELVEETRKLFPLSDKREDTFIGGLSMGGYGALRNGYFYSDTFSKVIALSSRVFQKHDPFHDLTNEDAVNKRIWHLLGSKSYDDVPDELDIYHLIENCQRKPELFLACGNEDFLIEENVALHDWLVKNNIDHAYMKETGIHNWDFWSKSMQKALPWALEK
ncbi:MAG: acetylesterase [Alkalibacterium sp.]|nr:acetylesterase [Alkalibacterium sp.]